MEHAIVKCSGSKNLGWRLENATLVPVMMDEEPDPDELLKIRCCNCRMTLKNSCCGNSALATPVALRALVLAEVLMKKWCKIGNTCRETRRH